MGKRGSETRRRDQSVLVRLGDAEYNRLSALAQAAGVTRAEYLRRLLGGSHRVVDDAIGNQQFTEADRVLLSSLTRSMGHLAGLMKLAVLKTPGVGPGVTIRSWLEPHRHELQDLQAQIRSLLGRAK
jgi:hypothetical protein